MSSFPSGISSMKLKVSTYEQVISSASLGSNSIQITNSDIFSALESGVTINPSIVATYSNTAFPSGNIVVAGTPYVPPELILLANGVTIKYNGLLTDVADDSARFIQADPRGTGMEWFAVVKNGMKPAITNYAKGIISSSRNALNFDGVDDMIDIGIPAWTYSAQFRTTMTIECWFKTTDTDNQNMYPTLISRNHTGGNPATSQFSIFMSSIGEIGFGLTNIDSGYYNITSARYNDAQWHHVAGTYNSLTGTKIIYIDGIAVRTDTHAGFDLPISLRNGEIIEPIWAKWMSHDPLERIKSSIVQERLGKLKRLFIDCGNRDQYFLQYGARQLNAKLKTLGISHTYGEFDDNHSGTAYRFDESLPQLLSVLV